MSDFTEYVDLAAERLGGAVLVANDEFFASKDNLLHATPAEWREGEYTDRGKWMDGWETRRRRTPGYDWCIVRLGLPGIVRGVVVDTSFFKGNFPEACSIEGCAVGGHPDAAALESPDTHWIELLPRSALAGDSKNSFAVANGHRFTHLRLNIFPDGGVARLRVHGEAVPRAGALGAPDAEIDLASIELGARVVTASDMFFGSRHNLIMPGRGVNMGDGWETRRRRTPGHEWCVVELGVAGTIARVEVDTLHFKGNAPESCSLSICDAGGEPIEARLAVATRWNEVLPLTRLQPHTRHLFEDELVEHAPGTHVRFAIHPEGGVSRLRLWGTASGDGRARAGVRRLDALLPEQAEYELRACCASSRWARRMVERRPFESFEKLERAAASVWAEMGADDWREAFEGHPRIGEKPAATRGKPRERRWAEQEQRATHEASPETLALLAEANRTYEAHFGHVYLVCATGKSAEQLLALLRARLDNEPETELRVGAGEVAKITALRLAKLVRA